LVENYVTKERIRLEIMKALDTKKCSIFFESLHNIDALKYIFPQLDKCWDHPHGDFHKEDVFAHSMLCGDNIHPKFKLLKLTGYLHDIGKPAAAKIDEKSNKLYFRGHDKAGYEILIDNLNSLKFSIQEIEYISNLVNLHMMFISTPNKIILRPKTVRKILKRLSDVNISYKDFVRLISSDRKANLKRSPWTISEFKDIIRKFKNEINPSQVKNFLELDLNGHDIMNLLGISPGPEVGRIIKFLEEKVIDDPKLNSKDVLIDIIKEQFVNN
jgi:tRNA nucleotidyltransferase/poly(A) polymerase